MGQRQGGITRRVDGSLDGVLASIMLVLLRMRLRLSQPQFAPQEADERR